MIGIPKNIKNLVELGLTDHLTWDLPYESHLFKLQEKLNLYISVIESKKIYKHFPDAKGRNNFLIRYILSTKYLTNVYVFWRKLTKL